MRKLRKGESYGLLRAIDDTLNTIKRSPLRSDHRDDVAEEQELSERLPRHCVSTNDDDNGRNVLSNSRSSRRCAPHDDVSGGQDTQVKEKTLSIRQQTHTSFVPYITSVGKQCLQPMAYGFKFMTLIIVFSYMLFSDAQAQSVETRAATGLEDIKNLKVGDKIPDEFWETEHLFYLNGDTVRQPLRAYRGKPIILDFWGQWCSPCIASLKKVNIYADKLTDDGAFISVTSDKLSAARSVWKKQNFTLPTIVEDNILVKLFPRATIPHVVWIDAEGTVIYISDQEPLNENNMQRFFSGQQLDIKQKTRIDKSRPLLLDDKVDTASVQLYQLVLKGRQDYLPMLKFPRNTRAGFLSRTYINTPLLLIYKGLAYDLCYQMGQTLFDEDFQIDDTVELGEIYTLDIISAFESKVEFYNHILNMLNVASGLVAGMDTEPRQCLVLKKLDESSELGTSGEKRLREVDWTGQINLKNAPLPFFQGLLMDNNMTGKYIVNETGYKGNIDAQLTVTNDLIELNRQLAKMGLQLEEAIRDVTIFTIKKTKPTGHE